MAASTGIASALLGPLAPPPKESVAAAAAAAASPGAPKAELAPGATKTMEELLNEIETLKTDVTNATKILEKIETGKKKAEANRERSVEGRAQVRDLTQRVTDLQKQMDVMTKDSDPSYPGKKFEKSKKSALKTLSSLSKDLGQVDKHLEKVTGSSATTPAVDSQHPVTLADGQPVAAPRTSAEKENSKGVGSLMKKLPFGSKKKKKSKKSADAAGTTESKPTDEANAAAKKKTDDQVDSDEDEDEDEEEDDDEEEEEEEEDAHDSDEDDVVVNKKKLPEKPSALVRKPASVAIPPKQPQVVSDVDSDESQDSDDDNDDDDDDDAVTDNRRLLTELKSQAVKDEKLKDAHSPDHRSRTPTTPHDNKKAPEPKIDVTPSSSPRMKKVAVAIPPTPPSRKKTQSPKGRPSVPIVKKKKNVDSDEDDSYFEDEDDHDYDDEEEELKHFRETDEREGDVSEHEYDDQQEDETAPVNAHVQELRMNKYSPGTLFSVTHDLIGEQTGDLTVHRGDILTLVEQRSDDWWLFKNIAAQQEGLVPINLIQLYSKQQIRHRVKPNTSATTLVAAFKNKNNIPDGFIASDLASLAQMEEYKLWRVLVPQMTESNLSYLDLYWRAETDKLHVQEVIHQKILTLKECVKIPRIKGEEIRVLDRCVRICLCYGLEIVSNIHTIRARIPSKMDNRELTEDWHFVRNDINTLTDEQPELLIRSNISGPGQNLKLLIELSQWCQSTVTQEKCEVGCGWTMVSIDGEEPPLITDTRNYNELLRGGHTDQDNILLDPQYKILRSNGISGMIDRYKRARIKFSIESRENDVDVLYDNLPTQSNVTPINLIKSLVFFRNELAFLLHKRHHPTGLSTTPIDSIFLSTFFQFLSQPDLIYTLNRLYRVRKNRFLTSSSSSQQQRELFIKVYEQYIYPLLQYRQLPPYDFHDTTSFNERRNLINDMVKRQTPKKKAPAEDILSILLDPNLTDKWTPFTTDEVCFTLQKYIHDSVPDIVA